MLDRRTVFEIHRLADEGLSARKIAARLGVDRKSVTSYLAEPQVKKRPGKRGSKLDPYRQEIDRFLQTDPKASAVVIP